MKKNILLIIVVLLLTFGLVGCGNNNNDVEKEGENNKQYDLGGMEFVIRANDAVRTDPREESYGRMYQNQKVANILAVEEKYNIKVVYKSYPSNASWGASRDNWIIQNAKLKTTDSHVFEVSSNSVATLAVQGAILPLDEYIVKYGVEGYWQKKKDFNTILGKVYAYDDVYSVAEEGIFYNSDLLGKLLGEENRVKPTELWEKGEWTWNAFYELSNQLNEILDENRSEAEGGPQYVIGGRTYDWFYPMSGTNGAQLVDSNFNAHLTDPANLQTLEFLSSLREKPGMWIDNAEIWNTIQPEFKNQNLVFHSGSDWYLSDASRWKGLNFSVDFVPYPVGPRVEAGESEYFQTKVNSEPAFVISSAFSKELIPEGYEDLIIHDELIFQIWSEIVHFPEIDISTGEPSINDLKDNYYSTKLLPNYASEKSREAHLSIWDKAVVDHFYSLTESQNHNESSFMMKLEKAIKNGDIRNVIESINHELQSTLDTKLKNIN